MKMFAVAAAVVLSGCAVKNTLLVDPTTGDVRNCSASGWGWIGTPMALAMHSSCKDSLRTIGYIPMDEIEPAVLSIDSAPTGAQVFAGPTAAELKPIGVAPMKIPHPKNNRGWLPECYQAKKPGHGDSAVDCRGKEWGDRDVTLPLKTPEK